MSPPAYVNSHTNSCLVAFRDLNSTEVLHSRVDNGLSTVQNLVRTSNHDLRRARDRGDDIRDYSQERFCYGPSLLAQSDQDCGTDSEFALAVRSMVQDLYDLSPLLQSLEDEGLSLKAKLESVGIRKREIIARCNEKEVALKAELDKQHIDNPFEYGGKVKGAKQACLLLGWLDG